MSSGVYEMKGPAAIAGDWRRFLHLTRTLAVTEFKLRFFDSALGYLWSLLRPLLLFGVLFVVFSELVKLGGGTEHYPLILLSGMVLYLFFSEATSRAVTSVVDHENLVRKIYFPRMVIPLSTVLTASFNFGLNLLVLLVFVLASGIGPRVSWLELPLLALALLALSVGVSMLLSALFVAARDVQPIWEVVTQALFYATPILYPIDLILHRNEFAGHLLMCNPLAVVIQQARHALIDRSALTAAEAIGGAGYLLIPAAIAVGLCVAGYAVFDRMAPQIAEDL